MKIYVVTSGSYSDYHIEQVFLDRKKAELYCKWHYNSEIEEFETHDDMLDGELKSKDKYMFVRYTLTNENFQEKERIYTELRLDTYDHMKNNTGYNTTLGNGHQIILNRKISIADDENELKERYLKVCRDLMSEIKQMYVDGFTNKQIEEVIKSK